MGTPAPDRVSITVSVDDAHLKSLDDVAARLRAAGMHVENSLHSVGAITGHVAAHLLDGLAKVPGVAAVEQERSYQLPPPGSNVQ